MHTTPGSLLEQLRRPGEQAAWERFVQLYTPLLCHWARRFGLQGSDAADLVQDVFAVLVEKIPEFQYDPAQRFRGWLWTIAANKCRAASTAGGVAAGRGQSTRNGGGARPGARA